MEKMNFKNFSWTQFWKLRNWINGAGEFRYDAAYRKISYQRITGLEIVRRRTKFLHTYTYTHTHARARARAHSRTHASRHARMLARTRTCTRSHSHSRSHTRSRTLTYAHARSHTLTHTHTRSNHTHSDAYTHTHIEGLVYKSCFFFAKKRNKKQILEILIGLII